MVSIELSFTDDPARLAARPAHRQRLADLHARGIMLAAGPWEDDSGALLLLLTTDEPHARELMAADPYFTTAGVQVVAVRTWQRVVGPAPAD
jgi:uncharacterized protein YciI